MNKIDHYTILKDTHEIVNRIEDKLDKVENRVSSLEQWRSNITGRIAVVCALGVVGFNMIFEYFKEIEHVNWHQ